MATKKATTTKNTSTKNTKTTTTTTSSRPYSSPNYTTTTTTTTTPKASTSSTSKNTTTSSANKSTNTTATKTANTSTPTVSKSTTTGSTTLPYTTPNASAYEQPKNTAPAVSNPISTVANNVAPYIQTAIAATGTPAATTTPTIANSTPSTSSSASDLLDAIVKSNTIAGTANTEPISNLMGNTPAAAINAERPYSNPNYEYTTETTPTSALDTLEDILSFGVASEKGTPDISASLGKDSTPITDKIVPVDERAESSGGGGHHSFGDETTISDTLDKGDLGAYADLLDTLSSEGIPGYEVPYSSPNVDTSGILGGGDVSNKGNDVNVSVGGGGSYGGGGSSSLPIGNSQADVDALYELLNQRLGEYDNNYESLLASLMDQYNLNYANLDDAYRAALEMLGRNYNSTEALLSGQLANSRNDLEDQRRRALQEAYISRMMNEKNLENILAEYGLSGGATESVLANMRNNYANNRNSVEQNISSLLNELLLNYANNISNARAKYNEGVMNAEQNRLSGRQSLANNLLAAQNEAASLRTQQRAAAEEDLFDALAKLTLNGYSY